MLSRRGFLKLLGAAPAVGAALQAPVSVKAAAPKTTLINRFSIAGFQYYDGPQHLAAFRPGDQLTLVAEPGNPHDEFAVQIYRGRLMLGHVPRSDNRHISRLLLDGVELQGRIEAVCPDNPAWRAVRVGVYLTKA